MKASIGGGKLKTPKAGVAKKQSANKPAPKKAKRDLSAVVGKETYTVWIAMLRELVPHGRTHRLSVVVAGMLQYAVNIALDKPQKEIADGSVEQSLLASAELADPEEIAEVLDDVTKQLFKDAGVKYQRTNARGVDYTILESTYDEFVRWFDMPWE